MAQKSIEKVKKGDTRKVSVELSLFEADLIRVLRSVDFGEFKIQTTDNERVTARKAYGQPFQVLIERSVILTAEGGLSLGGALIVPNIQVEDKK